MIQINCSPNLLRSAKAFCILSTFTLLYGFNALSPTTLKQNNQNWTTLNHEEITTNFKLIHIDVSENNITEFNPTIFSSHLSLEVLILSQNELYDFPPNINFLLSKSLERFECNSCGISIIYKETFSQIPKIKELNLSHNHLATIMQGAFDGVLLMKNLNLDFNQLKTIPKDLLSLSAVNTKLTMNHNTDFDFQPKEPFLKSKQLIEFQCNFCGITTIYEETFSSVPNIESIYLNDNKFSVINWKVFGTNRNIMILFLERNNLTEFPMAIFSAIQKLKSLCIDGNPLLASAINAIRNYYVKANLRTNCTEVDKEKYFENLFPFQDEPSSTSTYLPSSDNETSTEINSINSARIGISDAFIASYLLIILVAQGTVIGILGVYWFKIVLTDKNDDFDYSSNVLSNHEIYDVS